ncbi:hypothetical protein F4782DRAFT_527504 [Xylaria castorea]|nr:hypothetical protein F4782DRAFT_527504 [Xylaria castorea]
MKLPNHNSQAEHGHIDFIELLLHSGVETSGFGQLQYLHAISLALLNGHRVAADMIKSHRKLTEEDLSILERKHRIAQLEMPQYGAYSGYDFTSDDFSSSDREGEGEGEGEGGDENENNSADRRDGTSDDDPTVVRTKDTIFGQEGIHQTLQIGGDETLLFYDDETNENGLNFSYGDIQLRQEPSAVLDISAPSEGIYDFDYPLFGICDVGDPIRERP